MRRRHLIGVLAVLLLILAVWLVPMAFAAAGSSPGPQTSPGQSQAGPSQTGPSGSQCPFLQAHPEYDPHGAGGAGTGSGTSGAAQDIVYY